MYPIENAGSAAVVTECLWEMPDGVRLYTRYAVPKGLSRAPIVFMRTPYEGAHGGVPHDASEYDGNMFIKRGYAVVLQHCRGRGDSEGECIPYKNEREDGLASLEYIRRLPFYSGEIYLTGGSYLSSVHLSYLADKPEGVRGAALHIQTDRMYERDYRGGCNYNLCNIDWWARMMERSFPEAQLSRAYERPYREAALRVFGRDVPEYTGRLIHNTNDGFWKSDSRERVMDTLDIPILLTEGWYDFYVDGMFSMWERLPESVRARSAMIVGPYGHNTSVGSDTDYPLENANLPSDWVVEWFDSIREGREYKYAERGRVRAYSIAEGTWHSYGYPTARSRVRINVYPQAATKDNGEAFVYEYNPDAKNLLSRQGGIFKESDFSPEDGILSLYSEPADEEIDLFGKIGINFEASSDCEDTAFFARVYFVEDGAAYYLTDTVASLSSLVGDYTPSRKVEVSLQTPPICFALKPGMQIRVDISSRGGRYMPHPNTKEHFAYATEVKIATNTVYTDGVAVELPLAE